MKQTVYIIQYLFNVMLNMNVLSGNDDTVQVVLDVVILCHSGKVIWIVILCQTGIITQWMVVGYKSITVFKTVMLHLTGKATIILNRMVKISLDAITQHIQPFK